MHALEHISVRLWASKVRFLIADHISEPRRVVGRSLGNLAGHDLLAARVCQHMQLDEPAPGYDPPLGVLPVPVLRYRKPAGIPNRDPRAASPACLPPLVSWRILRALRPHGTGTTLRELFLGHTCAVNPDVIPCTRRASGTSGRGTPCPRGMPGTRSCVSRPQAGARRCR